MPFLVIELFPDLELATIVTSEDGTNIIFNTIEEAEAEADDCQDGLVVEVPF
jgi:hypothetical protein